MNKDTNKDLVNFAEVKLNFLVDAADNLVVSSSQLGEKMDRSELERELQPSNSDILVDPVNFANKDSFLQLDDDDDANLFWILKKCISAYFIWSVRNWGDRIGADLRIIICLIVI